MNRQRYYRIFWIVSDKQSTADKVISFVQELRSLMPRVGTRKLYHILEAPLRDLHVGRDKLFRILKANHMLITPKRSYRKTTESHHRFHKHKNLIQDMELVRPEQVWASDITYVGGRSKHTYLSLVTDAYSKKIVGYNLSDSLDTSGSLNALKMAIKTRMYKKEPLIHHSDRGFQYCSDAYQAVLQKHKIKPSMTETYDPYANAVAERVNGIIKDEFLLEKYDLDLMSMKKLVEESVDTYNKLRPHWSCSMKTPEEMHAQKTLKIKTYKIE
jgi:transposase InsO family protein